MTAVLIRRFDENGQMAFEPPVVDTTSLAAWCTAHLDSPAQSELFRTGHLTRVIGTRLADARQVVARMHPAAPRIAARVEVQHHVFDSDYPCPQPPPPPGAWVRTNAGPTQTARRTALFRI